MDRPDKTSQDAAPSGRNGSVDVLVVSPGGQGGYAMFEAAELSLDGALLVGGLLLEIEEEVTLDLRLPERGTVRAKAVVREILRDRGPAMRVTFAQLDEAERARLSRYLDS